MEKNIESLERKTTNIEIIYNDLSDLKKIASREGFEEFILEDSLKTIEMALENDLDKVELFNIFNLSLVVELKKPNYKDVLNNIIKHYTNEENYEKCLLIQHTIDKYEI